MKDESPQRGDLWWVDLGEPTGHEQGGKRPALVLSVDPLNRSLAELVVVLPLTTRARNIRSHIEVVRPEGDLSRPSFIKCEDIRSISKARLARRIGNVRPVTLHAVETYVRYLLGL
ncbi:MAG: putative endoribonuclease MazF7 [bacterium]|nr:putative endoribonuclease MazF7 [bacterium]